MSAQKGYELLIKHTPSGGSATVVGGLRTAELAINNEIVDVTTKDDNGARKLLAGAGVRSITITGSGVFDDENTIQEAVETAARTNALLEDVTFEVPSYGDYAGDWIVSSYSVTGEHNGAVMFSATFELASALTYTDNT